MMNQLRAVSMWAFAVLLAASASCGRAATGGDASHPTQPAAVPSVDVAAVRSQPLNATVSLPGELQPYEVVTLYAKVTGFVKTIGVDRGAAVKRGQVLVTLEAPELGAAQAEAEAKLQAAKAQLVSARARLASDQSTFDHLQAASRTAGVVAGNDLVVAQKAVEASEATAAALNDGVSAAGEAVRAAAQQATYLTITAPFDGVITERNVHPGDLVGPAAGRGASVALLTIEMVTRLRLVVAVPSAYVAEVPHGTQVHFTVPDAPGETFQAPITRVSQAIDARTRTMPVELDVKNEDGRLTPGTLSQVEWPLRRPKATLFVPATAVTSNLERTFVIRVVNGQAEWVDVKAGAQAGLWTEVFGAIHEGDQVVVRATDAIRAGTKLTPQVAAIK